MDVLLLSILAIACIAIGFILDNLLRYIRKAGNRSEKASVAVPGLPTEEKPRRAEQESGSSEGQPETPSFVAPSLTSVLHVWRHMGSKKIALEAEGKLVYSPSELKQEQLDLIRAVCNELNDWLGQETPSEMASTPAGSALGAGESVKKISRPSLHPIEVLSNALRAEIRQPLHEAEASLATQVDKILQEKILGTPLEKRGIRLLDAPDQGLWVQVGLDKYAGIEEVPDQEIKEIIREAAAEWGRRTSPRK